jgi:hypothetical protein
LADVPSVTRPFDHVDMANEEMELSGYPRVPLLPTSWRQVVGGVELTCTRVMTMRQLLKQTMIMVGQDVLQPGWVNPKTGRGSFLHLKFPHLSPGT